MSRYLLLAGLVSAVIAVFIAVMGSEVRALGPCSTAAAGVSPEESALLTGVNAWRGSTLGQPPMANSVTANFAAQIHAEALIAGTANGHTDSFGRSWADRLRDCGYPAGYVTMGSGEAVEVFTNASGASASAAVAAMTSMQPGHQSGAQAPVPWECSGVGYASNPNGNIKHAWVVIVSSAASSTACPQSAPAGGGPTTTSTATTASPTTATATATRTPTMTPVPSPTPTPRADGASVTLYAGWNLVTLPPGPVADVLHRAGGCYRSVYQLQGDRWFRYSPEVPPWANNLQTLNGGAYWIEGTAENCGLIRL